MAALMNFAFTTGAAQALKADPTHRFWPLPRADARTPAQVVADAAVRDDADPYSDCFDPWGDSAADDGGRL